MDRSLNINSIDTDFRAEVIVAGMIESGLKVDDALIVRRKGDKRGVSKDVDRMEYHHPELDSIMEYLYVYTNRQSIYDALPEGLFHQPTGTRRQRTKEDIIHDIKSQRGEEEQARKFFRPFEMILDRVLVETQLYEQKYDKAHLYHNLTNILKEQWNILDHLSTEQALLFIRMVPMLADVIHDLGLIARIMSIILNCPVAIREEKKSKVELINFNDVKLGGWKLGINSVLGGHATYDNPDIAICVGPVSLEEMRLFESNKKNDLILKALIDQMLPFDRNVVVKYETIQSETLFRLSGSEHTAYLGVNTTL